MSGTAVASEPAVPPRILELARRAAERGARVLLVGGCVRDRLLGREPRDWDLEVYGATPTEAEELFATMGFEHSRWVERRAPLLFVGAGADLALEVAVVPHCAPADAAAGFAREAGGRDLTINAMGYDPLSGEFFDPFGGRADLAARRLREVDAERFGEDPLRALRVARLAASLEAEPEPGLLRLCANQDLSSTAPERILAEFDALLRTARPSVGLTILQRTGSLVCLPELMELVDVAQDARWHPEGCVWTHTSMVVDEAAQLRAGDPERDGWLLWAALLHDVGKPGTTKTGADGTVRSHGHDREGARAARALLRRLRASGRARAAITALVRHHLAPAQLHSQGAKDRAYRRLARKLAGQGVDGELLERLARADHLGRTTEDALARRFEAGDAFRLRMEGLAVWDKPALTRVHGREVIARGVAPGPEVGVILSRCEVIADETGWTDGARILDRALREYARDRR